MAKQNSFLAGFVVLILIFAGVWLIQFIKTSGWDQKLSQQYVEKESSGMTQDSLPQEQMGERPVKQASDTVGFSGREYTGQIMTDEEMAGFTQELDTFSDELNFEGEPQIDFEL